MFPVIFSVGSVSISSFGIFLGLGFLAAVYTTWKLARFYEIDEEKILDLAILTFFGGMIGARVYFVLTHLSLFDNLQKIILISRYPGLSLWGGFLGGALALWFFSSRSKMNFWQLADFASVGLLLALVLGDIGCLLGGCFYGQPSGSFLATPVVGVIGKRFPIAVLESLVLLLAYLWAHKQAKRYHFKGKILSQVLLVLGIVKFIFEFFRGDATYLFSSGVSQGHLWSVGVFAAGLTIFYRCGKRSFLNDASSLVNLPFSVKRRKVVLLHLRKNCYNFVVDWKLRGKGFGDFLKLAPKNLKRRLNVKSTPKNLNQN